MAALVCLLPGLVRAEAGPPSAGRKQVALPVYGYRVVNVYPHDRQAYTQGLIWYDGFLYEGTGLNCGRSAWRPAGWSNSIRWTGNISAKGSRSGAAGCCN
jgi:glutamine cyclotransferase